MTVEESGLPENFSSSFVVAPGQAVRLWSCVAWRVHLLGADKPMRLSAAAAFYFLIVFGVGFVLGPVRVFWLEPRLGEAVATFCEAPFLLCAMLLAARWLPRALDLGPNFASLAIMGVGALLLQQFADFAVGAVLRGITPAQQLAHLSTPAGLIYVALLLAFVAMPVLANWPRKQPADAQSMQTALHVVKLSTRWGGLSSQAAFLRFSYLYGVVSSVAL